MSVDDFKDAFKHYTVTYLHDGWHNSFIEKRQAINRKNYRFNFTISDEDVGGSAPAPEAPAPQDAPDPDGIQPIPKAQAQPALESVIKEKLSQEGN